MDSQSIEQKSKAILKSLAEAKKKMLEFKKYKKTPVVISENGEIKEVSPEDFEELGNNKKAKTN